MTETHYPAVHPCGDSALTVELGEIIDADLNARVLALDAALARAMPAGVIETIPTYRSLFVAYDPVETDYDSLSAWLLERARAELPPVAAGRVWRFPVCYGGDHGIDLALAIALQHAGQGG